MKIDSQKIVTNLNAITVFALKLVMHRYTYTVTSLLRRKFASSLPTLADDTQAFIKYRNSISTETASRRKGKQKKK